MRIDPRARRFERERKDAVDIFVGEGGRSRLEENVVAQVVGSPPSATVDLTDFIPAGSWVWGIFIEILIDVTGAGTIDVGTIADPDRWGAGLAANARSFSTQEDFTAADSMGFFTIAALTVRLGAVSASFSDGLIRVGGIFTTGSAQIRRR